MHELGLLTQMAETVTRAANENNIDHVCGIVLEVGEASALCRIPSRSISR